MKYKQESRRWGFVNLGKARIGMTPNIYASKPARVAYELGYLARAKAKNNEDPVIARYESRRAKRNLPLEPFNAGYRNARRNPWEEHRFGYASDSKTEMQRDLFEIDNLMAENPSYIPSWAWPEDGQAGD